MTQYRTLGEGDVLLPGYEHRNRAASTEVWRKGSAVCIGNILTTAEMEWCDYRIPRPPLSLEQIAALPDGARVVLEYQDPPCVLRGLIANDADRAMAEGLARISGVRVWLAEDTD